MEIQKEIDKAINLSQKGNYNKAKRIYEEILREKPELAEIHYNLGIILKILILQNFDNKRKLLRL